MRKERHLILSLITPRSITSRLARIARRHVFLLFSRLNSLGQRRAEIGIERILIELARLALFKGDLQRANRLLSLPITISHHRDKMISPDHFDNTWHGHRTACINCFNNRANHRGAHHGRIFHAGQININPEHGRAIHLGRNIKPLFRLTHNFKVFGLF